MACIRLSSQTNNQESELFNLIYNNIAGQNEALADEYFAFFQSDELIQDFGDWITDFKRPLQEKVINPRKVDDNGQPRLFLDETYGKYYYLNKNDQKVYFPNSESRLKDLYSNKSIRDISKILAFDFVKSRIGDNFNDLDLTQKRGTLKSSIYDKIKSKANELLSSEDLVQNLEGETLEQSLDSIDEWVKNVENYFRELKLVYREDNEQDNLEEEETSERGEFSTKSSFEKSTKDNISSNVKLRLSLLSDTEVLDDLFYEPKFIEFDEVYNTLQKVLPNNIAIVDNGQLEDLFELYKQQIFNLIDKKPYLNNLYKQLNNSNISFNTKAEFVQAFNLDSNNFIGTMYSVTPNEVKDDTTGEVNIEYTTNVVVQNLSNVGAKNRFIKNNWQYNFVKKFSVDNIFNDSSYKKIGELQGKFNKLSSGFKTKLRNNEYKTQEDLNTVSNSLREGILSPLGIETTDQGFNHYLDNLDSATLSVEEKTKNLNKLFDSIGYLFKDLQSKKLNLTKVNPFDTQVELTKLSSAEAFFLTEGSDASIYSVGKSKWIFSYPSYLSNKLKQWKKDRNILLKHYLASPYNQGSYYMEYLLGLDREYSDPEQVSIDRISKLELNIFNSLQETGDASNAVDNKTMSKNDAYADIYNKLLGFRKGEKSYFSTPTPADKSTQYQFSVPNELMVSANARYVNGRVEFNDKAKNIIFNYVNSEYERMKQVQAEIREAEETGDRSNLRIYYHDNGSRRPNGLNFQLFPSLNYGTFNNSEAGFSLYDSNGNVLENVSLESVREPLTNYIADVIGDEILRTYRHMKSIGLLVTDINGQTINKGLDTAIWNSYSGKNKGLKAAGDIYMNGLISQIEYSKMFSGDVAYYKNMVDYKKRIPATYTDGLQLYLDQDNQYFNASVISGVEVATPYLAELKEIVPKSVWSQYENINSTDAQAWITPARWKFLLERLGKWSDAHDIIYDKIQGKNTESLTPKELKKVAQPLKGVYFDINDNVPVYLKYSQAVLIPNIVNNNPQLKRLYDKMTASDIDELITIDGVKVGALLPETTHNEDGTVKDDFTLNKMRLSNSGWKLQQDLPTKLSKQTMLGSQIQKNVFSGLAFNTEESFDVAGQEMTGGELIDYINNIVGLLSNKGVEKFNKEFGIGSDFKISNVARLNSALIDELKTRRASTNVIEALEAGVSPYGIPGYQQKLQNIFASIVTDRIVKVKTNGGSFIQMSNYGFSKSEAEGKGVRWTPWADETTQEYQILRDENGKEVKSANGKPIIRPAGILLSGSFIAKYIPNYQDYSNKELFGEYNEKTNSYEGGLIDYDILNNIIGYRIPNQGLASNDALQIVGILPPEVGDTVVAYTGITTKTGSDFDIDKMYMMIPNFKPIYSSVTKGKAKKWVQNELGLNKQDLEIELKSLGYKYIDFNNYNNMLNIFVEDVLLNPESTSELKEEFEDTISTDEIERLVYIRTDQSLEDMSTDELGNRLIEAYKAVFTNPNVIGDVMTPIDFDFMKDDVVDLFPAKESTDLSDFNIIDDVSLKYEFIAGKAGVGMTANALVDHVRGMMADLSFYNYYLGIGKVNEKGNTKFDEEFSEELSDADMRSYAKDTGIEVKSLKKIKIANSLSALMNAYVDIAKDPYITRGNWTTHTANVGFMLIRAGVHPFYVNAILGQPIIKEYVDFTVNSESKITKDTGDLQDKFIRSKITEELSRQVVTINGISRELGFIFETGNINEEDIAKLFNLKKPTSDITNIIDDITKVIDKYYIIPSTKFNFSLKTLRDNIKKEPDPSTQIAILNKFYEWVDQAKRVGENINASKIDVNGYGKNATSLIVVDNLINKLITTQRDKVGNFEGFETKLEKDGKTTLLGSYKNNSIDYIKEVMKANPLTFLVANDNVVDTFNEISKGIYGDVLTNDSLANKLENSYYSYFMAGFEPFNLTNEEKDKLIKTIPEKIEAYKNDKSKYNMFIDELDIKVGDNNLRYVGMSNRKKSSSFETELTNSWNDLLDTDSELAEDLIKYSYLTSGLQLNINQFYSYIPYEWFVSNNINDYVEQYANNINLNGVIDNIFIDQFFRNNYEDYQVVPRVSNRQIQKNYINNASGFIMAEEGRGSLYTKKTFTSDGITNYALFKLIGYTADGKAIYTRQGLLGRKDSKGNKIVEYSPNYSISESVIEGNNPKINSTQIDKLTRLAAFDINYYTENYSERNIQENDSSNDENDPTLRDCK